MNPGKLPVDRRVRRTRQALREALIQAILERGWEAVDVSQICERADIARSTFYLHFSGKEELLAAAFDHMRREVKSRTRGSAAPGLASAFGIARALIEHAYEEQRLFRSVVGRRGGHFIQVRFRQLATEMFHEQVGAVLAGWQREAAAHFMAGGLVEMLSWWLDSRRPQRPEEVAAHFERLTRPALESLPGAARVENGPAPI